MIMVMILRMNGPDIIMHVETSGGFMNGEIPLIEMQCNIGARRANPRKKRSRFRLDSLVVALFLLLIAKNVFSCILFLLVG